MRKSPAGLKISAMGGGFWHLFCNSVAYHCKTESNGLWEPRLGHCSLHLAPRPMNFLRTTSICLAIASLLVSDVVIAVHSASCGHTSVSSTQQVPASGKHTCCHHHSDIQDSANPDDSTPAAPEHDSDHCVICWRALICRFAVVCDVVLPPTLNDLGHSVALTEAYLALGHEFSSALSERGPPA